MMYQMVYKINNACYYYMLIVLSILREYILLYLTYLNNLKKMYQLTETD